MAAEVDSKPRSAAAATPALQDFEAWLAATPAAAGRPLGRGYQAATTLFDSPAGSYVVKRALGPWPWRALGEAAIRREHRVYARIQGVPGVPRCLGLIDGRILVLEYIDGGTFRRRAAQIENWDRYFALLLDALRGIHARGVAHGDLKRKDNLLVGPDERPYIVDFGVAGVENSAGGRWSNAIFRWARQYDYNAWIKLKYRRRLDALSADDAALYKPTFPERVARVIRVIWQKLTLRRLRRRVWPRRS